MENKKGKKNLDQPFIIRRSVTVNEDEEQKRLEDEKRRKDQNRSKDVGFVEKNRNKDFNIVYRNKPTKPLTVDELFGIKKKEEPKKVVKKEVAEKKEKVEEAETKFKSFSDNMNATTLKINLESPEKAKKYIEELSGIYEEQVENIKNSNTQIENYYDNLIAQAEGDTALVKALEEDKTKMMAENQKHLEEMHAISIH